MANIKSQKKRNLTSELSRVRNMSVNSKMKTIIKKADAAIESKDADQIKATVPVALSAIDRAVTKGVLHKNAGARKKSSLQNRVNSAS